MIGLYLLGAFFISIPIIVHLFRFSRSEKIFFSSVANILEVSSRRRRSTELKRILLLISRLLLVMACIALFLTFFIAGLKSPWTTTGIVFIDNSISTLSSVNAEGMDSDELVASIFSDNVIQTPEVYNDTTGIIFSEFSIMDLATNAAVEKSQDIKIFVSDFQDLSSENLRNVFVDTLSNYYLYVVERSKIVNYFFDSVYLESTSSGNSLEMLIGSTLNVEQKREIVGLQLFRNEMQIASTQIDFDSAKLYSFNIDLFPGRYILRVLGDDFEYDNDFYFTIEERRLPKIVVISDGVAEQNEISKVFSSKYFNVFETSVDALDYKVLEEANLILINEIEELPSFLIDNLEILQTAVLVLPPKEIDFLSYSKGFNTLFKKDTPEQLQEVVIDFEHPFFRKIFRERSKPSFSRIYGKAQFKLVNDFYPIISNRTNSGILMKNTSRPFFFFTCHLDEEYTNLASSGLFLPILYEIVYSSGAARALTYFYAGQTANFQKVESEYPPVLVDQGGERQIADFYDLGSTTQINIPETAKPGVYTLIRGQDTVSFFGINMAKTESHQKPLSASELQSYFGDAAHVNIFSLQDLAKKGLEKDNSYSALSLFLIALIVFFVTFEVVIQKLIQ